MKKFLLATVAMLSLFLILPVPAGAQSISGPALRSPSLWIGETRVTTRYGTLEGKADKAGSLAWLGIPYASAPTGALRWAPPAPPALWEGVREAKYFSEKSLQRSFLTGSASGSEDSLYLNVWRPAGRERDLPVYVWIHGGANVSGAADALDEYRGHALAVKANLVFVSVNYRLDLLGWFDHPALKTGDPVADSGNFGTLDLIAALRWIRESIIAFGGDPNNVTIAGQSAGAVNVLSLLIAPMAKGLFHKAVVESAYEQTSPTGTPEFAEKFVRRLVIARGTAKDERQAAAYLETITVAETAALMRSALPGDIIRAAKPGKDGFIPVVNPIFDGHVLPADGWAALGDPARRANVPVIIGSNKEETKLFTQSFRLNPRDPVRVETTRVSSALWKAQGVDAMADRLASGPATNVSTFAGPLQGRPDSSPKGVHVYRFDWGSAGVLPPSAEARLGASHAVEIPFFLQTDSVLGNYLPLRVFTKANEKGRRALQGQIGDYLSRFVRTGDPNGGAVPQANGKMADGSVYWESWDARSDAPAFLVLDAGLEDASIRTERGRLRVAELIRDALASPVPGFKESFLKSSPELADPALAEVR
jgi:para-nitrobenzyl esterase